MSAIRATAVITLAVLLRPGMCSRKLVGTTISANTTIKSQAGETTSGTPKIRPAGIPVTHTDDFAGGVGAP